MDCVAQPDGSLRPFLGGSPFNMARAAALRGAPVGYLNPLSTDRFGLQMRAQLEHDGVQLLQAASRLPSSLAVVQLNAGQPSYGFYREGIADRDYTVDHLLRTLRARERLGGMRAESHGYDGMFRLCTLGEIVDFVAAEAAARGRTIGLIPEIKHSTYFAGLGFAMEDRLLDALHAHSYLAHAPVIVQSFEIGNLKALKARLAGKRNIRLMQLTENTGIPADRAAAQDKRKWAERLTPAGIAEIATYADFIAPSFRDLIPLSADGHLAAPSGLIAAAHQAGLLVGTWTFRPENRFLAADFRDGAGDGARNPAGSIAEIRRYLDAGVDALFSDDPALVREALSASGGNKMGANAVN